MSNREDQILESRLLSTSVSGQQSISQLQGLKSWLSESSSKLRSGLSKVSATIFNNESETTIGELTRLLRNQDKVDKQTEEASRQSGGNFLSNLKRLIMVSSKLDRYLILLAILLCCLEGLLPQFVNVLFGQMSQKMVETSQIGFLENPSERFILDCDCAGKPVSNSSHMMTAQEFESSISSSASYYLIVAVIMFLLAGLEMIIWRHLSESISNQLKRNFYKSTLARDASWLDANKPGELINKFNNDIERIKEGTGEHMSVLIKSFTTALTGFVWAFALDPTMAACMLPVAPILVIFGSLSGYLVADRARIYQRAVGEAVAVAEETLSSIKTVSILGGHQIELDRYGKILNQANDNQQRSTIKLLPVFGFVVGTSYAAHAVGLYAASRLIYNKTLEVGQAIAVIMQLMQAAGALGAIFGPMKMVSSGVASIPLVLDEVNKCDTSDSGRSGPSGQDQQVGHRPLRVKGEIRFNNVSFSYPSRKTVPVLRNLSLDIGAGQSVAVCGRTGSGKSTLTNLLLRFYEPDEGSVSLDGSNLANLNKGWLRSQLGVVEQEPALFDCTIFENIALGSTKERHKTLERVVWAAKLTNAHEFILSLPEGYETRCGQRGVQLSGGQKQRIAIARALLAKPKILLLDEATSALDSVSENIVQEAICRASKGRTVLTIAHRLSTIRNADTIHVMEAGQIVDTGTHDELMAKKGLYFSLVTDQLTNSDVTATGGEVEPAVEPMAKKEQQQPLQIEGAESVLIERKISTISEKSTKTGVEVDELEHVITKKFSTRTRASHQATVKTDRVDTYELGAADGRGSAPSTIQGTVKETTEASWADLIRLVRPEKVLLLITLATGLMYGCLTPVFGIFMAEILNTLGQKGDQLLSYGSYWSIMLTLFSILSGSSLVGSLIIITITSRTASKRIGRALMASMLRQDAAWHDEPQNSSSNLITQVTQDVPKLDAIFQGRFFTTMVGVSSVSLSVILALYYSFKTGLVVLLVFPLAYGIAYLQTKESKKKSKFAKRPNEIESSRLADESFQRARLIQAINQEQYFQDKFNESLEAPYRDALKEARLFGCLYGLGQGLIYAVYAASFRWGAFLIARRQVDQISVFRVFYVVQVTSQVLANWVGAIGDMKPILEATKRIQNQLKIEPKIDNLSRGGAMPELDGAICFKNVHFSYPSRPSAPVLRNLNFNLEAGKTLALVGHSGAGKSSLASLLLRLYDPDQGTISIDGFDLRSLNLRHLRHSVGLVAQEPSLFERSIKENILYGLEGAQYGLGEAIEAAKAANIHEFIASLPLGYETRLGAQGTQLSGGQKQRLAIARTLVRRPSILVLDEATSALDTESEAIVNEALDRATVGKTCIKIAHRLSSVRGADKIAVMQDGCIVESGTHDELMALGERGYYHQLMAKQDIRG